MDLIGALSGAAGAAGGEEPNPNAWDISKAYYDAGPDAWNISKAAYHGISFTLSAQDTDPRDLFFKPDGTKMYVVGDEGNDVNEYTLSAPWRVSSASFTQNFSVATQETRPSGLFFKPDGTKMYVLGFDGDDVNEYSLSSAWDISTASYVQNFSVSAQETDPNSLFFKPDGTKMFVMGTTGDDVNEYSLSSAWDISTASYVQNFSVSAQETAPNGLFFKPDGTKMYVTGGVGDDVNEYSLSTPWDISTASYVQLFSVSAQEGSPEGIFFHPEGTGFYIVGSTGDRVWQYNIGGFSVGAQEAAPQSLFFKPDGTKMYVMGRVGDDVNEYNLSISWDITTASYSQVFSVATEEIFPAGLFFKPDGTNMYVIGRDSDNVNEYSLSTPWDISTASYVQLFSVSAQEATPTGLFFKPDGTKMYVIGASGDEVNEYSLSTAWDISTASYVQNFSVSAQDTFPEDVFFKPDGTKMYVTGGTGSDVNEYSLSTPWDISTASYVQNFSFLVQDNSPVALFWKGDGSQFWVIANFSKVLSYKISPT